MCDAEGRVNGCIRHRTAGGHTWEKQPPSQGATFMVVKTVGFGIEGLAFESGPVAHELCDTG